MHFKPLKRLSLGIALPHRDKVAALMRLLQQLSKLLGAWDITPARQQFPISRENQHAKLRRLGRFLELRRGRAIKIGHNEDVTPRIMLNFLCVVPCLKPFCCLLHAVADERGRYVPHDDTVFSDESNNRDHPAIWITQTRVGNPVPHHVRLFPIALGCQHQYGHVSIGGGKLVAINVHKTERIDRSS